MDASELREWRKTLGLTQLEAAEKLGVGRTTFQNWEHGRFPIALSTKSLCESLSRRWKQRPGFGPVTLVYAHRPIWPAPECKHETRVLHCEFFENNEAATARVRLLASQSTLHNPAILDAEGDVILSTPELSRECTNDPQQAMLKDGAIEDHKAEPAKQSSWWQVLYGNKFVSSRQIKAARALLGWSQADLARASQVSIAAIVKVEGATSDDTTVSKTLSKLRHAIELAGIEFLERNKGGEGVRLREVNLP